MKLPQDWRTRMQAHLKQHAEPEPEVPHDSRVASSVLVPVAWNRESGRDEILLTKRTMKVETHKGQVSFPGGLQEPHDTSLLGTALRECEEEVGIRHGDIEVLGPLTPVTTRGNVIIYPWVGRIELPYIFTLNHDEVDRLLYLPLTALLTDELRPMEVRIDGLTVKSIGIVVDGELVWGATARMLVDLRKAFLSFLQISEDQTPLKPFATK